VIFRKKILCSFAITLFLGIGTFVFIFYKKNLTIEIPLEYSSGNIPIVQAKIGGKTLILEIDLGSEFPLTIYEDTLKDLPKIFYKKMRTKDVFENVYTCNGYIIPKFEINKLKFKNIIAFSEKNDFKENTTLWIDKELEKSRNYYQEVGCIGFYLLEKFNLYFDFPNHSLIACKKKSALEKKVDFSEFFKVDFIKSKLGIVLQIETDYGIKNVLLDTGCTCNYFRASQFEGKKSLKDQKREGMSYYNTEKFIIGGVDFGKQLLYSIDISPNLKGVDGFLGMDFLKNHRVFIDYKEKAIYFSKSAL
jgi:hypothetical protein